MTYIKLNIHYHTYAVFAKGIVEATEELYSYFGKISKLLMFSIFLVVYTITMFTSNGIFRFQEFFLLLCIATCFLYF